MLVWLFGLVAMVVYLAQRLGIAPWPSMPTLPVGILVVVLLLLAQLRELHKLHEGSQKREAFSDWFGAVVRRRTDSWIDNAYRWVTYGLLVLAAAEYLWYMLIHQKHWWVSAGVVLAGVVATHLLWCLMWRRLPVGVKRLVYRGTAGLPVQGDMEFPEDEDEVPTSPVTPVQLVQPAPRLRMPSTPSGQPGHPSMGGLFAPSAGAVAGPDDPTQPVLPVTRPMAPHLVPTPSRDDDMGTGNPLGYARTARIPPPQS